ncbi:restriction endonuclease [Cenarchaeum symbiosum A]|uniref:Restriction endonuclease n=1 Tax=Cenarchaeum symbiosum (strain A) TaxID=414004 RepID=A0RWL9_CENSY|nr:restriction endonuclease [Cenarchaeum symbiosum A]
MMTLKEYQRVALGRFEEWYVKLKEQADVSTKLKNDNIPGMEDYPRRTWKEIMGDEDARYVSMKNGVQKPIPNICFKVPTGGGKTLMAAAAIRRMGYSTGLVVWMVISNAIYKQTLLQLNDKKSLIRKELDIASGNAVKILEKNDRLNRQDVENQLCILILMKQSTAMNDETFLKLHRDSGSYLSFFPPADDPVNEKFLAMNPTLAKNRVSEIPVQSLANVIRLSRPVVILDESHKTKTRPDVRDKIVSYVEDLNPRMVLEFSATPVGERSNILVNVSGKDMDKEEMLKLPIKITTKRNSVGWKNILKDAYEKLCDLQDEADKEEKRYIRPIMLIRVERTGKDQRNAGYIHADDVREYMKTLVPEQEIAIKSHENDGLKDSDLMSGTCPIRYIITKSALQEGWDCPFAYVLVILDNLTSKTTMTQMLGRVLRQPNQKNTENQELDRCYVYCRMVDSGKIVGYVKSALEDGGLNGISGQIHTENSRGTGRISIRPTVNRPICLPKVTHSNGRSWTELDYDRHILAEIDWNSIGAPSKKILKDMEPSSLAQTDIVGLENEHISEDADTWKDGRVVSLFDLVQGISDEIPNPWQAARIMSDVLRSLKRIGRTEPEIFRMRDRIIEVVRDHVNEIVAGNAEDIFRKKTKAGTIRFNLEVSDGTFCFKDTYDIPLDDKPKPQIREDGKLMQRNLFDPMYEDQFDSDSETQFACYLDETESLKWWHRVAARGRGEYYLRGWKRDRIFPDFIAMSGTDGEKQLFRVYEIKGTHLDNPDSAYKKDVLEVLEGSMNKYGIVSINDGSMEGEFEMIMDRDVRQEGEKIRAENHRRASRKRSKT